jgi:hypothetical protein
VETHRAGRFQVSFPSGAAPRESWAFPESRSGLAREYDPSFIFFERSRNMEPARRIYVEISSASAVGSGLQSFRRVRS